MTDHVHLKRTYEVPIERVFRALIDPAELVKWWGPRDVETSDVEIDLRVGGGCRYVMHPGGHRAVLLGRIVELDPPRLLTMTHQWEGDTTETLVTIRLEDISTGTRLDLVQTRLPSNIDPDEFTVWWNAAFDALGNLLESDLPMSTTATAQLCRAYFDTWTQRHGPDALRPLLAENFVFEAGPMRIEGRDKFLSIAAWPEHAKTEMIAEAYDGDHGLQLYAATNGSITVKIVEHLVVENGRIAATETITDRAAFGSFLGGGD